MQDARDRSGNVSIFNGRFVRYSIEICICRILSLLRYKQFRDFITHSIDNCKKELEIHLDQIISLVEQVYNKLNSNQIEMPSKEFKREYLSCVSNFDGNPNEQGSYFKITFNDIL